VPSLSGYRPTLRDIEIAAVVFALLAGLYGVATSDRLDARFAIVLLAPTVEAALPLLARRFWPARAHGARVVALLLVVFYVALAPVGIDAYLYLPALLALGVVVFVSNRERWRALREQRQAQGARRGDRDRDRRG